MKHLVMTTLIAFGCVAATQAAAQVAVSPDGRTIGSTVPAGQADAIDYANAKSMDLPTTRIRPPSQGEAILKGRNPGQLFGPAGAFPGSSGSGEQSPVQLHPPLPIPHGSLDGGGVEPQEFGTSGQPFTTSRATANGENTVVRYPFRAAGKLFFKIGTGNFVCTASLIKPGIAVTAAHCVANYGASQFYSSWVFVPAYTNGTAPYGKWTVAQVRILTAYYNGTDGCAQYGVICPDDVAVLLLSPQNGAYPGSKTGWFGYGYDGYGFNGASQVLVNQLGYPVALDGGLLMQRNDSQGYVDPGNSNNTIIGSLMTGGSSGGPWLVNLGMPPVLSGVSFGTGANHNVVVGVTSWGYTDTAVKQQGAAPFTSGNIFKLIQTECGIQPAAC
jgi:V8-like Glu-specific endopeptidase